MNEAKFQAKLREYAKLIVKIGANVQKDSVSASRPASIRFCLPRW